jgi:hypothetical protein
LSPDAFPRRLSPDAGGAFSPFGKLTKPAELVVREYTGDDGDGDGVGGVAEDANEHNDWSKGGVQWQKD